jgi:hypothetical protein
MINPLEHLRVYGGGADERVERHGGTCGSSMCPHGSVYRNKLRVLLMPPRGSVLRLSGATFSSMLRRDWRTDTANQRGGGGWMGADKKSIQEFGLWTQFHSYTSTSFSCQVHAATGVLLDLGAKPNQQPRDTRSGNTHDTTAGSPNRSGRFLKPVRPLLLDLASQRKGQPARPVWQTGHVGSV